MAVYGIDLGTTFCSVAYALRGVPVVVALEGGATLASTVLLDGRSSPRALVGREAVQTYRSLCDPGGLPPAGVTLVRGSKNHLAVGSPVAGGPPWRLGEVSLGSTDVAALVLRALAERVRRTPGLPALDGVVVTHPQRFRNRERKATAQAVHLAGLHAVAMLPEPDAAAYAYGLQHREGTGTFMVFDFGGGTLDVTVMRREGRPPTLTSLASYGVHLGGLAIDAALRDRLFERYTDAIARTDIPLDALDERSREVLLDAAEGVKIQLNVHATSDVNPAARTATRVLSLALTHGEVLPRASVRVTLGDVTGWTGEVTERAVDCAQEALDRANLGWTALDDVLMVGGSSWLLAVQHRLQALCHGRVRLYDDAAHPLNPATAVAAGAALYADGLTREDARVDYRGVIPDALGVRARERDAGGTPRETLAVLVPTGTRVPYEGRKTFRKRGSAATLPIEVLEGGSLAEAVSVGRFSVALDTEVADGADVEVTLRIDRAGVLSLDVRDPRTGALRAVDLSNLEGLYADDELESRKAMLAAVTLG